MEVDAAPQADLSAAMAEIRSHYEGVTEKNHKALEAWFLTKVGWLHHVMHETQWFACVARAQSLVHYDSLCLVFIGFFVAFFLFLSNMLSFYKRSFYIVNSLCNFYNDLLYLQTNELNSQVSASTLTVESTKSELTETRRSMQSLEIELQSQLSMVRPQDLMQCCSE